MLVISSCTPFYCVYCPFTVYQWFHHVHYLKCQFWLHTFFGGNIKSSRLQEEDTRRPYNHGREGNLKVRKRRLFGFPLCSILFLIFCCSDLGCLKKEVTSVVYLCLPITNQAIFICSRGKLYSSCKNEVRSCCRPRCAGYLSGYVCTSVEPVRHFNAISMLMRACIVI